MPNSILVVDDLSLTRVILRARLQAACYDVRLARSGAEALEIAKSQPPDLVLMDCEMPGLDGPAICQILRADPRLAHIPVILFSADTCRARRLHALRAGADDFLSKPMDEPYLLSRLRELLRRSSIEHDFRHHATPSLRAGVERAISATGRVGRVALVQPEAGSAINPDLRAAQLHSTTIALPDALAPASDSVLPDVFLLAPEVIAQHGLAIISDLCARPATRDIPVMACLPAGLDIPCGIVLDLGADTVLRLPLDREIAQLHLETMILRKTRTDALRAALGVELDLASRDPLTGLYNRRHALSCLDEFFDPERAVPGRHLALLMIDLDDFKTVNDRFGHSVGDQILIAVAQRMRAVLRAGDLLARYGGEEFLLALPDISAQDARDLAERLRSAIEGAAYQIALPAVQGHTQNHGYGQGQGRLRVTASVGLAMHDCTHHDPDLSRAAHIQSLIDQADQALHSAKTRGRNRVVLDYSAVA